MTVNGHSSTPGRPASAGIMFEGYGDDAPSGLTQAPLPSGLPAAAGSDYGYGAPDSGDLQPAQSFGEPPFAPAYGEPAYGQPVHDPYAQSSPGYAQPSPGYDEAQFGYAQPPAGYGQSAFGPSPAGNGLLGQPPYGQALHGQAPYGQAPYGQTPYAYGQPAPGPAQTGYGVTPEGPSVVPVVLITAVFGVFGAVSAYRRAQRAQSAGLNGNRYWLAFTLTFVLSSVLGMVIGFAALAALASLAPAASQQPITSNWLESSIVAEGSFTNTAGKAVTAESATCTAGKVDADGAGTYRCVIAFKGTPGEAFKVTVTPSRTWTIAGN